MYFRGVLDIEVGDGIIKADEINASEDWDRFSQEMPEHGFIEVPNADPWRDNDVVGMAWVQSHVHHVGVITSVKDATMLHHLDGSGLSSHVLYTPAKQRITLKRWRHKDLL